MKKELREKDTSSATKLEQSLINVRENLSADL